MPDLIPETGVGVVGANAYGDLAYLDDYWADDPRWAAALPATKTRAGILAARYMDGTFRYPGSKLVPTQGLGWPRKDAVDHEGNPLPAFPGPIQEAWAELAIRAVTGPLTADAPRGGAVKSETVGPISTTYFDNAPSTTRYFEVEQILLPYVLVTLAGTAPIPVLTAGTGEDPIFDIGMHDPGFVPRSYR